MVVRELGLSTATPKRGVPTWLPAAVSQRATTRAHQVGGQTRRTTPTLSQRLLLPGIHRAQADGPPPKARCGRRSRRLGPMCRPGRLRRDAAAVRDRLALPLLLRAACAFRGKDRRRLDILAGLASQTKCRLLAIGDVRYHHPDRRRSPTCSPSSGSAPRRTPWTTEPRPLCRCLIFHLVQGLSRLLRALEDMRRETSPGQRFAKLHPQEAARRVARDAGVEALRQVRTIAA